VLYFRHLLEMAGGVCGPRQGQRVADPYTEELPAPLVREWQMMKDSIERAKRRDSVAKDPPSSEKLTPAEKGKNKILPGLIYNKNNVWITAY